MKRLYCIFLCIISTICLFAQDETKSINVTVNSNDPTIVEFNTCKLSVQANKFGNSDTSLSVEVENNSSYDIFLFGRAYPEKVLKKRKPSIRFDKKSYGTTSKDILTCGGLGSDDLLQIEGNMSRTITIPDVEGEYVKCELPLYIAKNKKRKKYFIMSRVKVTLNVKLINPVPVIDEPDPSLYEGIKLKYDNIIADIKNVTICQHKQHKPTASNQKKPYLNKINNLIGEIDNIKDNNNWNDSDEAYQPFKELIKKLKNVKFNTTKDCGIHIPIPEPCSYCNMTPQSVLQQMESIYKKLDQGSMTKSDAKSRASALYKAYNSTCPNLKTKVGGSNLKTKIDRYYQSIINY